MKIGTLVKSTDMIAYWWERSMGIVIDIDETGYFSHTHQILWSNGDKSFEQPQYLKEVKHGND